MTVALWCEESIISQLVAQYWPTGVLQRPFTPAWPPAACLSLHMYIQRIRPLMCCEPLQNKAIQSIKSMDAWQVFRFELTFHSPACWFYIALDIPPLFIRRHKEQVTVQLQCFDLTMRLKHCCPGTQHQHTITVSNVSVWYIAWSPVHKQITFTSTPPKNCECCWEPLGCL